ncbi:MAG: hypothetical protein QXL17_07395 [Candidatus Thermoplasmatota archaeon]
MKQKILIILTFLLFSIIPQNAVASPSLIVSDYTLYPEVFMPGDSGILTVMIKNAELTATRTTTSDSVTTTSTIGGVVNNVWIVPAKSKHREIKSNLNYEDVGTLAPGVSVPLSFPLSVDPEMPEGYYFPTVRVDVETYTDVSYPIPILVSNTTVEILPASVPTIVSQSGNTQLSFTIVNHRPATVYGVTVSPKLQSDIRVTPEKIYLGDMDAYTSKTITFSITPTKSGQKNILFQVTFKNGQNLHVSTTNISFTVVETFDIAPIITSYPVSITKGSSAKIRLEVYNAKTEKITGVLITPICDAIVVPSQYFIGAMDPDDVFSAAFDIFTTNVEYGNQTISFMVSYKQGNDYYETPKISKTFEVIRGIGTTYQSQGSSSASQGIAEPPSLVLCLTTFIITIVVFVILILLFVRWKKRRKTA